MYSGNRCPAGPAGRPNFLAGDISPEEMQLAYYTLQMDPAQLQQARCAAGHCQQHFEQPCSSLSAALQQPCSSFAAALQQPYSKPAYWPAILLLLLVYARLGSLSSSYFLHVHAPRLDV